ncbi:acyl-CoA N-acyltransferase [Xylogone sp. PMI_703]|nr:acyl-CoA N-acyltransferase [Xylogone sp. PMI_703]
MPTKDGVVVRHAYKEDVPVILELILELADYEKEISSVEATVETLSNTIAFAPSPNSTSSENGTSIAPTRPARCLLISSPEGKVVGMALYFYNYSTWRAKHGIYLEDLYVRQSERGHGYGQRLLGELAKEVLATNGGRLEWSVLKWNTPSIQFYERIGAKAMTEWQTMRVDRDGLEELAKRANA